jgi:hypothetical protein
MSHTGVASTGRQRQASTSLVVAAVFAVEGTAFCKAALF